MSEFKPITKSAEIREQLARIAASNSFRRRRKLLKLLEYLTDETTAGRGSALTQKRIAADVYGLRGSFDPQSNVTVRISVSRLRNALHEYYMREAEAGEARIQIPPRRYFVAIEQAEATAHRPSGTYIDARSHFEPRNVAKKITHNDLIGEKGINLIQRICLDMGFVWYSTGLEAGIDGYIEIRTEAGEVTNCIIQVQSKATERPFDRETETTFEFQCSEKDLTYWLAGNAPVILVRSRPRTNEAYWVSLKDYFTDHIKLKAGKIVFDKIKNRFDVHARTDLQGLARRKDSGLYLGTRPKTETIYSNLLAIASLPRKYYVAATEYRTRPELFAAIRESADFAHGEWTLRSKMLMSFHDLSLTPWTKYCDRGSVEELDTEEWALTEDAARQRHFVQLLNACLRSKLYRNSVKFAHEDQCYFFRSTRDLAAREYIYQSREHRTSRTVFKGYPTRSDPSRMSYYRHSAFSGRFVRYDSIWYLQITPTYYFTRDGERVSRFAQNLLSGIKRLETNQAVHGQIVMWAHLLTARSLFDTGPQFLEFGSLLEFQLDVGLDDDAWLKREEDADKRASLESVPMDDRQRSLVL